MPIEHFDTAIIGAGPAGYTAAEFLGSKSLSVCLIDISENNIGGTCLNEGCIPVKSLLESAHLYSMAQNGPEYGLSIKNISIDIPGMKRSLVRSISTLKNGVLSALKKYNVVLKTGKASFSSSKSVTITQPGGQSSEISADSFIIASGSKPKELAHLGMPQKNIINSSGAIDIVKIPQSILIIGGGAIGCEFATLYHQLGSAVTLAEVQPNLLPGEDEEICRTLRREMQKKGIDILNECQIKQIQQSIEALEVVFEMDNHESRRQFDMVLVAVGRVPNTDALQLDRCGVESVKGYIPVGKNMETNVGGIFAAGDVVQTPAFAHTAYREGLIAAESCYILKNPSYRRKAVINYDNIPRIVFSEPQIGCTGITEKKAAEMGLPVNIHKRFFKSNGKAVISRQESGFIKILTLKESGVIVGAAIIGPSATEIIHELGLAVETKLTIEQFTSFLHGHPTLSELSENTFYD